MTCDDLTSWLNTKAMMLGAGKRGGKYKDFADFSKSEVMKHLSVYLLHGISPSPQVELKFKNQLEDPVNGSDLCNRVFGKRGVTRHKEFKAFFAGVNPIVPTPPTYSHPNWKIDPLLKHMRSVSQSAIHIGRDISVDEQDIGFQGRHKDKQRVTFKKVGDGFLVDALCADGYTFAWYFRNQLAPKYWTDKELSPLHARVMALFQQLPDSNYKCGMDNLFMSPKFAKIAKNDSGKGVMIHGVCRVSRGIPTCIQQVAVTKKEDLLRNRGIVKASVLKGDAKCDGLVAASLYDSKPVYFISNACERIEWTKKIRRRWHKEKGRNVRAPFYRLNLVDEYNLGMGHVDQSDQLRLQYRIHYWLRNRKWWWAIFFWFFELSLTNCYVLYLKFWKLHLRKPPYNHYEFIKCITLAWLDPVLYWPVTSKKRVSSSSICTTATASSRTSKKSKPNRKRNSTLSDLSLDPYCGAVRCRLDTRLNHLPEEEERGEAQCQMHYWKNKSKYRKQLMKCATCQVTLCLKCYKIFHDRPDLTPLKE